MNKCECIYLFIYLFISRVILSVFIHLPFIFIVIHLRNWTNKCGCIYLFIHLFIHLLIYVLIFFLRSFFSDMRKCVHFFHLFSIRLFSNLLQASDEPKRVKITSFSSTFVFLCFLHIYDKGTNFSPSLTLHLKNQIN